MQNLCEQSSSEKSAELRILLHLLRHNREELAYIVRENLSVVGAALRRSTWRHSGTQVIGYVGWLGHRNLGDEAMFEVISRSLSPWKIDSFLLPAHEKNLDRLDLSGRRTFRAVVLGGGTLLNPLFLERAKLAKSFGIPFHVAGTGAGSPGFGMPDDGPLDAWRTVLEGSVVAVRGPASKRQLEAAGIPASVLGDPALGLTPLEEPRFRSRRRLVVNLAQQRGAALTAAEASAVDATGKIARDFGRSGGELVGVALGNGDFKALEQFRRAHQLSCMTIENHRTDARKLLGTIQGSIGLIGVRLHSAVLACSAGVPPVLLAYRSKCADFMESMDLGRFAVPFSSELAPRLLYERWEEVRENGELASQVYFRARRWRLYQETFFRDLVRTIDTEDTAVRQTWP